MCRALVTGGVGVAPIQIQLPPLLGVAPARQELVLLPGRARLLKQRHWVVLLLFDVGGRALQFESVSVGNFLFEDSALTNCLRVHVGTIGPNRRLVDLEFQRVHEGS